MKTKKILIKSRADFEAELHKFARKWDDGQRPRKALTGEYFESLEAVRRILTEKRLELWRTIRDRKPNSILHLARMAERDFRGVHRDVMLLVSVGLVTLRREKGKHGDSQRPISLVDTLEFKVA